MRYSHCARLNNDGLIIGLQRVKIMSKNKLYKISFSKNDINSPTGKMHTGLANDNFLSLCADLKTNGFKKKSKIRFTNLTEEELKKMYDTVFPPKKSKNPVENLLKEKLRDIKIFHSLPKQFKDLKEMREHELVGIEALAKPFAKGWNGEDGEMGVDGIPWKQYIIKRQPTFFAKGSKVSAEKLESKFTPKAIELMVEDGYLEEVKLPIYFAGTDPINDNDLKLSIFRVHENEEGKIITEIPLKKSSNEKTKSFEEFALDSFKEQRDILFKMMYGESKSKLDHPMYKEFLSANDNVDVNSYIDDLTIEFENICEKLDFIIDNMAEHFPNEKKDIYLSLNDSIQLNKALAFGGKVKKYKGHNIVVR